MKAIEVIRPGEMHIAEIPDYGRPAAGEAIVRMKAAGICGSDLHIYNGHSAFAVYPNIMGHELAGEVVEVGEGVSDLRKGDRVAVNNVLSCGACYACSIGRPNVCRQVKVLGVHVEGGYKQYLKIDARQLYKFSEKVPWEHAALIEPYSIAAQVIDRGRLAASDRVLICGAGPLGLIILQAVKRQGVQVAILDRVASRLARAAALGADLVIDTTTDAAQEAILQFTNREGASLIVESTGSIAVLEMCVRDLASQAGRVVVLGFPKQSARISPFDIMRRELDLIGSRLNNEQFPTAIGWMERGEVDPGAIISHRFRFEQAKNAMDFINEKPEEVLKVVLQF